MARLQAVKIGGICETYCHVLFRLKDDNQLTLLLLIIL